MLKWALKRESFDSFICSLLLLFYYMGTFGVIGRVKIILRPEHLSQWNKITSRFFGQATLESLSDWKKNHPHIIFKKPFYNNICTSIYLTISSGGLCSTKKSRELICHVEFGTKKTSKYFQCFLNQTLDSCWPASYIQITLVFHKNFMP